jgi:uncharacterized protein DUF3631
MADPKRRRRRRRRDLNGEADPSTLLDDVMTYLGRFVVLTNSQKLVVALWVIHTHCIEWVTQTPYLSITSPESECGKSRLMETLELIVRKSWMVIRPSDAVAFRFIHSATPTLLLDEVDTIFNPQSARYHEGLRAILDAGHRRGAQVPRAADFGQKVEHFSPFCAKAVAGIGELPDTIAKRAIYLRLIRKSQDEHVERFITRDIEPFAAVLDSRLAQWAQEHGEAIGAARPPMPTELSDRMQEGCEVLVAIAEWFGQGQEAREALVSLLTGERLDSSVTIRARLIRDIHAIWSAREKRLGRTVSAIPTSTLIADLARIEEAMWDNYYGRGLITPNDIANLLRHYNVGPRNIKMRGGAVKKGYKRDDLYDVWSRY